MQIARDLKPVYTTASESEVLDWFGEFFGEMRKALSGDHSRSNAGTMARTRPRRSPTTNAIESISARPDGPPEVPEPGDHEPGPREGPQALDQPTEGPLNTFDLTFDGRLSAGRK